jgi:hypothetical protein
MAITAAKKPISSSDISVDEKGRLIVIAQK